MDIVELCSARAALAGNPSDGYGGAVVSIPILTRCTVVTARPDPQYRFTGPDDEIVLATWNDVVEHAWRAKPDSPHALALATAAACGPTTGFALDVATTIPRSVGLAGSSAIVIAALRALHRHAARTVPQPDVLASMALAVEVDGLGIAAGLQDRVVQAYERPMLMRFDAASMRELDGRTIGTYRQLADVSSLRLFVATLAVGPSRARSSSVISVLATLRETGKLTRRWSNSQDLPIRQLGRSSAAMQSRSAPRWTAPSTSGGRW